MTIIAMASESDSLNTFPIRAIALTDGASLVPSDTACSRATCSSEGTARLTITVIANHPRMMGTDSWRTIRAANVPAACS